MTAGITATCAKEAQTQKATAPGEERTNNGLYKRRYVASS